MVFSDIMPVCGEARTLDKIVGRVLRLKKSRSIVRPCVLVLSALLVIVNATDRAQATEGGTGTRLANRDGLAQAFLHAAESIKRRQHPAGYWETAVTARVAFEAHTSEVNVFTPAIIVDLLDPVARDSGLTEVLDRAREYLRSQIEPTGLVRYHGNPGPVDRSQRACELPPDADDTALAWRIAPKESPRLLRAAAQMLAEYRTDDGLYRTWLASQRAYRCFYERFFPRDPNPPDVGIQMHVYLFLAKHDVKAAAGLCRALRQRIADDRIWVWYTLAPLLPLIREVDLAQAGCPVRVPDRLLERVVSGQTVYMAQARLFRDLLLRSDPSEFRAPVIEVLSQLAADGFAKVSLTPPLLYHNALSASPPHYHWSEDVGYALWVRLYVETARRLPDALRLPVRATSSP